jgi:pimeloyl-ACP methyl ester carboxylesterase
VLTDCDAFDNFLPPMFRGLQVAARVPGALNVLMQPMRIRGLRRLPMAFGLVTKRPIDHTVTDAWLRPFMQQRAVRRDTAKLLRGITKRDTLAAAERLRRFDRPALWSGRARTVPSPSLTLTASRRCCPTRAWRRSTTASPSVPEDQPERLADAIVRFVRATPDVPARTVAGTGAGRP